MKIEGASILVTGGASLIGSYVAEALLDAGAREVRVLDNLSMSNAGTLDRLGKRVGLRFVRGDVLRDADVRSAVAGADGVFHGAGIITVPLASNPGAGLDVNVRGTATTLAAAAGAGVRKVVLMSSVSIYGNTAAEGIEEDTPVATAGLGWPSQLYGGSKLLAEGLCRAHADQHGMEWVALRAPSVYGAYQHARGMSSALLAEIWRLLKTQADPELPVDPLEAHDYIYVSDVADAAVAAFESETSGTAVNIASGESVTFETVVRILSEIVGARGPARFNPAASGVRLTASHALSYSIERARRLLGWEPRVSIEDGLGRLARWLDEKDAAGRGHGTG